MSWNYRIIRKFDPAISSYSFHIHEVYYDAQGNIELWTESPVPPTGETLEELQGDVELISKAFLKPVLEIKDNNDKKRLVEIYDSAIHWK